MADQNSSIALELKAGFCPEGNRGEPAVFSSPTASRTLLSKARVNFRIPVRVSLSIAITSIVCFTILILSLTILSRQKENLYFQTVEKGKVSLNYFATNANIPLLNDDTLRLNRLIKDAASIEGILYAAIVDRKNKIKAHSDPGKIGLPFDGSGKVEEIRRDDNLKYFHYTSPSGTQVLNLSRPITFKGKELGAVHVGLSLDFINQLIYRETVFILILSFFIVLLGIGVAIFWGCNFSRPISKLVSASQQIGKGNLQYRLHLKRNDELGDLASAFNYMAEELEKKDRDNAKLFADRNRAEKEAKNFEDQLRQSQKMEAVGQLAGGIAHDFNNSLTLIKVCSQLVIQELKEEDPIREKIQQIDEATTRSGDLARQLLTFSRRHIEEPKILDLNSLLNNLNKMLQRAIGENIELLNKRSDNLGRIKGDPGQIEQVIVNLVVNARDAMPGGGKLTLETANADLDQEYSRGHIGVAPGSYVMLSITDTGLGIPPDTVERIFDPFFTTKEEGKGTGLGLFMVYGIVQKHRGHIQVESKPGIGTTFKIYLPRASDEEENPGGEQLGKRLPRGGETILIVEDDNDLRTLMAQALKQQGYKALEAANGEEGLLLFDKYRQEINLIITDIVLPMMTGLELIDLLRPLYPQMKVVYISGYPDNSELQKRNLTPDANFLPKPFSLEDLAVKIRKTLDQ